MSHTFGNRENLSMALGRIQKNLQNKSDWKQRYKGLEDLERLLKGGEGEEGFAPLFGEVCSEMLKISLPMTLIDLRSEIVRQSCQCISLMTKVLGSHMRTLGVLLMPNLLTASSTVNKVIRQYAVTCTHNVIENLTGKHMMMHILTNIRETKSKTMRPIAMEYLEAVLANWPTRALTKRCVEIENTISFGLDCPTAQTRDAAARSFFLFLQHFPKKEKNVIARLPSRGARIVERMRATNQAKALKASPNAKTPKNDKSPRTHRQTSYRTSDKSPRTQRQTFSYRPSTAGRISASSRQKTGSRTPTFSSSTRRLTRPGSARSGSAGKGRQRPGTAQSKITSSVSKPNTPKNSRNSGGCTELKTGSHKRSLSASPREKDDIVDRGGRKAIYRKGSSRSLRRSEGTSTPAYAPKAERVKSFSKSAGSVKRKIMPPSYKRHTFEFDHATIATISTALRTADSEENRREDNPISASNTDVHNTEKKRPKRSESPVLFTEIAEIGAEIGAPSNDDEPPQPPAAGKEPSQPPHQEHSLGKKPKVPKLTLPRMRSRIGRRQISNTHLLNDVLKTINPPTLHADEEGYTSIPDHSSSRSPPPSRTHPSTPTPPASDAAKVPLNISAVDNRGGGANPDLQASPNIKSSPNLKPSPPKPSPPKPSPKPSLRLTTPPAMDRVHTLPLPTKRTPRPPPTQAAAIEGDGAPPILRKMATSPYIPRPPPSPTANQGAQSSSPEKQARTQGIPTYLLLMKRYQKNVIDLWNQYNRNRIDGPAFTQEVLNVLLEQSEKTAQQIARLRQTALDRKINGAPLDSNAAAPPSPALSSPAPTPKKPLTARPENVDDGGVGSKDEENN